MSKAATMTRRTFAVASAAVIGGVAFGYYAYRRPVDNPLLDDLPAGSTPITPYLRIDTDGITIITPRAEMGQGAHTVLAALVAEELDLAWDDIRVEHGPASAAYYNGAAIGEGLPFMSTDRGLMARNARAFGDVIGKFMGMQITGGSSTVPDGFDKMRRAGAAARARGPMRARHCATCTRVYTSSSKSAVAQWRAARAAWLDSTKRASSTPRNWNSRKRAIQRQISQS